MNIVPLAGIGEMAEGSDLSAILCDALVRADLTLTAADILVVTQKIVSKAEGRFRLLSDVVPSDEAERLAVAVRKDPRLGNADAAAAAPGVVAAIEGAEVMLNAPSNPYLSIDPILAVPGIRAALARSPAPVVAVSPLVGGKAVKGPTAKVMGELGVAVDNDAIAAHYAELIDGLLIDAGDAAPAGMASARTGTLMTTLADRERVARAALDFAQSLRRS